VAKPDGKRPLGRPRPRWEGNIQMNLQTVRWRMGWMMWLRVGTFGGYW